MADLGRSHVVQPRLAMQWGTMPRHRPCKGGGTASTGRSVPMPTARFVTLARTDSCNSRAPDGVPRAGPAT